VWLHSTSLPKHNQEERCAARLKQHKQVCVGAIAGAVQCSAHRKDPHASVLGKCPAIPMLR